MTLPDGYSFVQPTSQDKEDIYLLDLWSFPTATTLKSFLKQPMPFTLDRSALVRDAHGKAAAFHTSFGFQEFGVPGAAIPASGLSWVGVHPQHRRKGILRAMINRHFQDCIDRGEAVSVLYAAEPTIYGRFGYGRASHDVRFTLSRGAEQRAVHESISAASDDSLTVRIELFSKEVHEPIIESLHAQAGRDVYGTGLNRPGWAMRETQALKDSMHTFDEENAKTEALRIAIIERDGQPVAYSRFRRTVRWQATGPSGDVDAGEAVALDAQASFKLWSVLTDLDLTDSVTAFMVPTDDPVLGRLENTRSITMHHVDNVWARIIDVRKALESRVYCADLDVVLEITDSMIPANQGRWRLTATSFNGPDGLQVPRVESTTDDADIVLDIRELSTVYLGGPTLASLVASGLVQCANQSLLGAVSTGFGWPHAPMSTWVF